MFYIRDKLHIKNVNLRNRKVLRMHFTSIPVERKVKKLNDFKLNRHELNFRDDSSDEDESKITRAMKNYGFIENLHFDQLHHQLVILTPKSLRIIQEPFSELLNISDPLELGILKGDLFKGDSQFEGLYTENLEYRQFYLKSKITTFNVKKANYRLRSYILELSRNNEALSGVECRPFFEIEGSKNTESGEIFNQKSQKVFDLLKYGEGKIILRAGTYLKMVEINNLALQISTKIHYSKSKPVKLIL